MFEHRYSFKAECAPPMEVKELGNFLLNDPMTRARIEPYGCESSCVTTGSSVPFATLVGNKILPNPNNINMDIYLITEL